MRPTEEPETFELSKTVMNHAFVWVVSAVADAGDDGVNYSGLMAALPGVGSHTILHKLRVADELGFVVFTGGRFKIYRATSKGKLLSTMLDTVKEAGNLTRCESAPAMEIPDV